MLIAVSLHITVLGPKRLDLILNVSGSEVLEPQHGDVTICVVVINLLSPL